MTYIPERNDVIWLDFNPSVGKEQNKRRPALILSPKDYNKSGLALVVPISSGTGIPENKGFRVIIPHGLNVQGAISCDQIKSIDWASRKAEKITTIPTEITADVLARAKTLLLA